MQIKCIQCILFKYLFLFFSFVLFSFFLFFFPFLIILAKKVIPIQEVFKRGPRWYQKELPFKNNDQQHAQVYESFQCEPFNIKSFIGGKIVSIKAVTWFALKALSTRLETSTIVLS